MREKNKYVILVVMIISLGLMLTGGTYAWLTFTSTVGNNTYNGTSTCFLVTYNYNNDDNTLPIAGTLFQSATPKEGLFGKVTMALSSSCAITSGTATLTLYFNSTTSDVFFSHGALKYAVYDSATATTPISSGTLSSKSTTTIGSGSNFALTKTARSFYVYIWLDGEATGENGNNYIDLVFDGYIKASATQTE